MNEELNKRQRISQRADLPFIFHIDSIPRIKSANYPLITKLDDKAKNHRWCYFHFRFWFWFGTLLFGFNLRFGFDIFTASFHFTLLWFLWFQCFLFQDFRIWFFQKDKRYDHGNSRDNSSNIHREMVIHLSQYTTNCWPDNKSKWNTSIQAGQVFISIFSWSYVRNNSTNQNCRFSTLRLDQNLRPCK